MLPTLYTRGGHVNQGEPSGWSLRGRDSGHPVSLQGERGRLPLPSCSSHVCGLCPGQHPNPLASSRVSHRRRLGGRWLSGVAPPPQPLPGPQSRGGWRTGPRGRAGTLSGTLGAACTGCVPQNSRPDHLFSKRPVGPGARPAGRGGAGSPRGPPLPSRYSRPDLSRAQTEQPASRCPCQPPL